MKTIARIITLIITLPFWIVFWPIPAAFWLVEKAEFSILFVIPTATTSLLMWIMVIILIFSKLPQ